MDIREFLKAGSEKHSIEVGYIYSSEVKEIKLRFTTPTSAEFTHSPFSNPRRKRTALHVTGTFEIHESLV
jgi:hypothetical protein